MMVTAFFRDDCTITAIPSQSSSDERNTPRLVLQLREGLEDVCIYLTEKQANRLVSAVEVALAQVSVNRSKPRE